MTCTILLELTTPEGKAGDMIELLRAILPDTRARDGFVGIELQQDQDKPETLVLIERWRSRADYEAYLAWRTERGDLDKLGAMLAGPPSIRYFDSVEA